MPSRRILLVLNPRVLGRTSPELAAAVRDSLGEALLRDAVLETDNDGANPVRIAARIEAENADLLVAAGGDGTVGDAVSALMRVDEHRRPPLAILPLGTANNVARSLGLRSIRSAGDGALALALGTILRGRERPLDVGRVGERLFAGSLALGMDADILRVRNAAGSWIGDWPPVTGYPLYLASFTANLLLPHGAPARVGVGASRRQTGHAGLYGVLILNVALYAGEFRFASGDPSRDGMLDLHCFECPADYVYGYVDAWRRQLAHGRGERVTHPGSRRRVRNLSLRFERPVPGQLDGEELPPAETWKVEAVPRALQVRVPE